jgi:lantibiotic transport system permease protein
MNSIKTYKEALVVELIKMKNTLGIWTSIIFPALVVLMNFLIYFNRPKMLLGGEGNPWVFVSRNAVTIYSILFLPLFIAIITFYINYNEHRGNSWRQIYSLPLSKGTVYFSKLFNSFIILCISMLLFYVLNYISMIALKSIHPQIPFNKYNYDPIIPITFLKITLASMGVLAIQFLISIQSGNFIYPLGFGLLATFTGALLAQWEKIIYYPYSYPFQAAIDLTKNNYAIFNQNIFFSLGVFVLFSGAGYYIHLKARIR